MQEDIVTDAERLAADVKYSYGSPYDNMLNPQSGEAANLLSQINPADIIETLTHKLRGEKWLHKEQKWTKIDAGKDSKGCAINVRMVNELGIAKLMAATEGIVNTNCTLSNLKEDKVENITVDLGDELADLLAQRYREFEIDKADLTSVLMLCLRMSFFSLQRGFEEGDKNLIKRSIISHEHVLFRPGEKRGFASSINPFSKK